MDQLNVNPDRKEGSPRPLLSFEQILTGTVGLGWPGLSYSLLLISASNQHSLWTKVELRVFELWSWNPRLKSMGTPSSLPQWP